MFGKNHLAGLLLLILEVKSVCLFFLREENRSINQPIKSAMTRPNTTDSQMDKKLIKPTAQKLTNPSKTTINAPVKPMSTKRTLSPVDDRLSDEECKFIYLIISIC